MILNAIVGVSCIIDIYAEATITTPLDKCLIRSSFVFKDM